MVDASRPGDQPVVHLLFLCGSLRQGSVNAAVLRTAAMVPAGVIVDHYDGMATLPFYSPDLDLDIEPLPEPVADLRGRIATAGAILIATPEYAGTLPGAFKNLLDWTVGGTEMTGRPVAWINASTGPTGAERTYRALRDVFGFVQPRIIEDACARIPVFRRDISPDGLIHRPELESAIALAVRTLVAAVRARDHPPIPNRRGP